MMKIITNLQRKFISYKKTPIIYVIGV